jgi:hypothetical protein
MPWSRDRPPAIVRTRTAMLLVVAALATACGSDDDGGAIRAGETPSTGSLEASDDERTDPTSAGSVDAADRQVTDDAVLEQADLQEGWQPATVRVRDDNAENTVARCAVPDGAAAPSDDGDPRATGNWELAPAPGERPAVVAFSNVELNRAATEAEETLAGLRTEEGRACVAAELRTRFETLGVPEVGAFTVEERSSVTVDDDFVALHAEVPLLGDGLDARWFADLIAVARGRALVTMNFGSVNAPFDPAEAQRLTDIVLGQLPDA